MTNQPKRDNLRESLREIFSGTMAVVQDEDLDKAIELFDARLAQQRRELVGKLPENRIHTPNSAQSTWATGYNEALADCKKVIEDEL